MSHSLSKNVGGWDGGLMLLLFVQQFCERLDPNSVSIFFSSKAVFSDIDIDIELAAISEAARIRRSLSQTVEQNHNINTMDISTLVRLCNILIVFSSPFCSCSKCSSSISPTKGGQSLRKPSLRRAHSTLPCILKLPSSSEGILNSPVIHLVHSMT